MRDTSKNVTLFLGVFLASVLVSGGCFELLERARYARWKNAETSGPFRDSVWIASANPGLIWENRPRLDTSLLAINRWGFRDVDYETKEKPAGVYRIAFVGDSATFGASTRDEDLFVSLFQHGAENFGGGRRFQAMNFSVDGYDALQLSELVRSKVVDFSPDEVVYVLCLDDFDFHDSSAKLKRLFRPPGSFLLERLRRPRVDTESESYSHYFAKNREAVFAAIHETAQLLARRHIDFLVAVLPVFDRYSWSFREYQLSDIHSAIGRSLGRIGIRTIDLLEYFRSCSRLPPSAYFKDAGQLNRLGHRWVARALLETVPSRHRDEPSETTETTCAALRDPEVDEGAGERQALEAALASGGRARLSIDSTALVLEGFWPIEQGATRAYAWSRSHSVIHVTGLRPSSRYRVSLGMSDWGGQTDITVGAFGRPLKTVTLSASDTEVPESFTANAGGNVDLELRAQTWRPSERGSADTRALGISLAGIEIRASRE